MTAAVGTGEVRTVAVVGLGRMGSIMTSRIVEAGLATSVFDVDPTAVERMSDLGATAGSSIADASASADLTILSLPTPQIVEAVVGGADGILASSRTPPTIVDMSTIDPATSIRLHELVAHQGGTFLEAPVSGSVMRAREGTLTIMVGGSEQALERCKPVLQLLGSSIVHMGGPGAGQMTKLCNNMLVGVTLCALAESFLTGVKGGLDAEQLRAVICESTGSSWLLEHWLPLTSFEGDYSPRFALELLRKDALLFGQASSELRVPTPLSSTAQQMLSAAENRGLQKMDMTAVFKLYEELAGVELLANAPD